MGKHNLRGSRQPGRPCPPITAYDPIAPLVPHGSAIHPKIKIKGNTTEGKQRRAFLHHHILWAHETNKPAHYYDENKKKKTDGVQSVSWIRNGSAALLKRSHPVFSSSLRPPNTRTTHHRRHIYAHGFGTTTPGFPLFPSFLPPWRACRHIPRKLLPVAVRYGAAPSRIKPQRPSRQSAQEGPTLDPHRDSAKNETTPRLPPPPTPPPLPNPLNGTLPSAAEGTLTFVRSVLQRNKRQAGASPVSSAAQR